MIEDVTQSNVAEDQNRWSDDDTDMPHATLVWSFERDFRNPTYSWSLRPNSESISWKLVPKCKLHSVDTHTGEYNVFSLSHRLCRELAFLDLDHWSNAVVSNRNTNRIRRYLQKLREDVIAEFHLENRPMICRDRLRCTIPWAIRVKHGFGHSGHGRRLYVQMCQKRGWEPYSHDDAGQYRKCKGVSRYPPRYHFLWRQVGATLEKDSPSPRERPSVIQNSLTFPRGWVLPSGNALLLRCFSGCRCRQVRVIRPSNKTRLEFI
jgi:hypothetical protein